MVGKSWNILLKNIFQGKLYKIFIFGLVIALFVFKIGFLSNFFSNSTKLGPFVDNKNITSDDCLKVLNYEL